jgi:hypothetical protein
MSPVVVADAYPDFDFSICGIPYYASVTANTRTDTGPS